MVGIEQTCPKIQVLTKKMSSIFISLNKVDGKVAPNESELNDYPPADKKLIEQNRENMISAISAINAALGTKKYEVPDPATVSEVYKVYCKFADPDNTNSGLMGVEKTAAKNQKEAIYKYYEYTQFKKAKFKCTKLQYSETTGKVNEIVFLCTGEIE